MAATFWSALSSFLAKHNSVLKYFICSRTHSFNSHHFLLLQPMPLHWITRSHHERTPWTHSVFYFFLNPTFTVLLLQILSRIPQLKIVHTLNVPSAACTAQIIPALWYKPLFTVLENYLMSVKKKLHICDLFLETSSWNQPAQALKDRTIRFWFRPLFIITPAASLNWTDPLTHVCDMHFIFILLPCPDCRCEHNG